MKQMVLGLEFSKPVVYLFNESGIGAAEFAARTAYDSFNSSENYEITKVNDLINTKNNPLDDETCDYICDSSSINGSKLLSDLAWVHFHHSVLEHINLSYFLKGTSRGVLQELVRHRIASYTVKSTRYTMNPILYAFLASLSLGYPKNSEWFVNKFISFDALVTSSVGYNKIEAKCIYDKLFFQLESIGIDEFLNSALSKDNIEIFKKIEDSDEMFTSLMKGKSKRNSGDNFKHIVTDNFKVDLMMTVNIRSLKNFFELRDSGAAYIQIRWLAEEIKKITPIKYLKLIDPKYKGK